MRRHLAVLALILLLVGCEPNRTPRLHDIYLYGLEDARFSYLYGLPGSLTIDGVEIALEEGRPEGAYAVTDALLADGAPFLRAPLEDIAAPTLVERIPLTTDLMVSTNVAVPEVVYFDGAAWFTLLRDAAAGLDLRLVPRRRIGRLQGLGDLSQREAAALADALEARGRPVALTLLPDDALPERSVEGVSEYLRTGFYLQTDIRIDSSAYRAPAQQVVWEVLAQGSQALGAAGPGYVMVTNRDELLTLWNRAHGSQLTVPPLPDVDFSRETVLAVFLGQKPTGGYGAEVRGIVEEDRELFVDLVVSEPAPGAITTQALTSPWVMIRVLRSGYAVAWFRDPTSGQLFGAARAVN